MSKLHIFVLASDGTIIFIINQTISILKLVNNIINCNPFLVVVSTSGDLQYFPLCVLIFYSGCADVVDPRKESRENGFYACSHWTAHPAYVWPKLHMLRYSREQNHHAVSKATVGCGTRKSKSWILRRVFKVVDWCSLVSQTTYQMIANVHPILSYFYWACVRARV